MPSTTQTFNGSVASTGDEVIAKYTNTLYPGEITDIDTGTDTPIITILEDDIGTVSGWAFSPVGGEARQNEPDMSWFWKHQPL